MSEVLRVKNLLDLAEKNKIHLIAEKKVNDFFIVVTNLTTALDFLEKYVSLECKNPVFIQTLVSELLKYYGGSKVDIQMKDTHTFTYESELRYSIGAVEVILIRALAETRAMWNHPQAVIITPQVQNPQY